MTSDIPTGDQATTEAESTPPRRATRRRVTRPTSAPQTSGPAPIVVPAATAPGTAGPPDEPTPPATSAPAQPEQPVTAEDAPATGSGRRPRRATRRTAGPTTNAPDEAPASAADADSGAGPEAIALPEPAQEPAPSAAALSLDDIVLPGGPAADSAPSSTGAAKRTSRAKSPSTTEQPAKRSRSRAAKKAEPAAEAEQAPEAPAPETQEPDAQAPETRAPKRRRAGRATAAPAAETSAPETPAAEPAAKKSATRKAATEQPAAQEAAEPATARTAGGGGSPRLATTALLFQAPEMSGPRKSRRAQAPAGPPRSHDDDAVAAPEPQPADDRPATDAPTDDAATGTAATTSAKRSTKRSGTSRRARSTKALEEAVESSPAEAPTAAAAEPAADEEPTALTLSEAEEAAVSELEVIESELESEGVALPELRPEDFREDGDESDIRPRRRRRRGGRGRRGGRKVDQRDDEHDSDDGDDQGEDSADESESSADEVTSRPEQGADPEDAAEPGAEDVGETDESESSGSSRRRRRRRRGGRGNDRDTGRKERAEDEVTALKGSTRLEAKRQRRRDGRDAGRRRQVITEAEFLARRESVQRSMFVREEHDRTQIAVLEDGVLVEHYVSQQEQASMVGNVYLGRVQNVLPSMEAAFVDVGKGRNAVLYAGEVNWDAAGIDGQPRRIEDALKSGDSVLVQVTKDPIGHKGARLTSQITLAGRYLVFVPGGGMTGISRKLPDTERSRLKKILRDVVPDGAGVIVRTAAEGASEDELRADVERLEAQWQAISEKAGRSSTSAPSLLQGEADMAIRVVRDIFNDDFTSLVVQGDHAWSEISSYVAELAPDLRERVSKWIEPGDVFAKHRVDEQLAKGMDRKVWLPSGGSLVIDRTEAMTVVDVNTGKFTGSGGTLEETVTRNNLEAAEEIVRQLRLRDIGGIIVIDFVDMVLESNRDLVLRRLVECLGRDRTKHQVAEVTSLGLVQMTRKRVGQGLVEAFSSTCEHCKGRGFIVHSEPVERGAAATAGSGDDASKRSRRKRGGGKKEESQTAGVDMAKLPDDKSEAREAVKATLATIAAAAAHAHDHDHAHDEHDDADGSVATAADTVASAETVDQPEPVTEGTAAEAGAAVEAAVEAIVLPEPAPEPGEQPEPVAGPEAGPAKGAGAEEAPEQADDEAAALTDGEPTDGR
ncbi:RNAse G [Isoptericola sp. CG 20/1183]|uniref:RNAse G n=1 Tax=Isoptericola halotolerans TaxID=300560 RepID=A0ABX5EC40_9MICO|nr:MULTISPECIES: Rne/Rng family ribonuclease [Isoptericola]PRZ05139.1 RNAse G [Isoptericola halotolerans]PRZ05877.1 RNAse G [Isoptericola sp. CG 20/1183]